VGDAKITYGKALALKPDDIVPIGFGDRRKGLYPAGTYIKDLAGRLRRPEARSLVLFGGVHQHERDGGMCAFTQNSGHRAEITIEGNCGIAYMERFP